jgi:electron transport complex protein RnfE
MPQRSQFQEFTKGLFSQNLVFVLVVGMCPALATTTGLKNAAAMGVAVIAVVTASNVIIALLRRLIPNDVRIPCFVVVIASFVTMIEIAFKAFMPLSINQALGIFIPLIVVNCIILHRAESFAYQNGVLRSLLDGLGAGVGYAMALCLIATIREALGNGTIWGYKWLPTSLPVAYVPASILIQAPGAFLVLGLLLATFNWLRGTRSAL